MRTPASHTREEMDQQILLLLVEAFRGGDRQAFRALYDRYEQQIYRFCRHMVSDDDLAGDAFQETFIRAYENRTSLRTTNIQSWLYAIARRVCLNLLRSKRKGHEAFDETYHGEQEEAKSDILLREHLDRALAKLPITLKEALILRDVEGHSYREIADIVGIDLSLAKVRVYRARLHMRRLLSTVVPERRR